MRNASIISTGKQNKCLAHFLPDIWAQQFILGMNPAPNRPNMVSENASATQCQNLKAC